MTAIAKKNKKVSHVLFDGEPTVDLSHVGTYYQPSVLRDKWGKIPAGFTRSIRAELAGLASMPVPSVWYAGSKRIHLKITAEVTGVS